MLTLPALMIMGIPPEIANATNRVGVLMQSLAGMGEFYRHRRLDTRAMVPVLIPVLIGSLVGALTASFLPAWLLKPALLTTMIVMALVLLVKPDTMIPDMGSEAVTLKNKPSAIAGLFFAGIYGGFVQAGVGFILIAALAGGLGYDLIRSNALKVVCTAALSVLALMVFVSRNQVLWVPGIVLAIGSMIGAVLSVRFVLNISQNTLKWILFVMVTLTCLAAWFGEN